MIINRRIRLLDKLLELDLGSFAEPIMPLLDRIEEIRTKGKCPEGEKIGIRPFVNFIPSKEKGRCTHELIVVCFDCDSLDERLREMVYHAGIYCPNKNRRILFLTSKWDTEIYEKHERDCRVIESWEG